jgi:hypothetical protein
MAAARPAPITFTYTFTWDDGATRVFTIELDPETLAVRSRPPETLPDWTALSYRKCANCPLDERMHPRCPIAVSLVPVVEAFGDRASIEEVDVRVEALGREYRKRGSLQHGVSALIGILNVTSGCPVMDRLRPMVDTHLPFATPRENTYRVISMYLTAQFFRARRGGSPDWRLEDLLPMLQECHLTNSSVAVRLKSLGIRDAALNALWILNALGELASLSLEHDMDDWQRIFDASWGQS